MAKDKSGNNFSGRFGDRIYYFSNGQHLMRAYSFPDPELMATGEQYQEVRDNNTLFGYAATASATIRAAFAPYETITPEHDLHNRVMGCVMHAVKAGENYTPGAPELDQNGARALNGLLWHSNYRVNYKLSGACQIGLDFESGAFQITLEDLDPLCLSKRKKPDNTHFNIRAILAAINLKNKLSTIVCDETGPLPYTKGMSETFTLSGQLKEAPEGSIMIAALGIQATTLHIGKHDPLMDGSCFILL